jgi:hypothetical protein
VISPGFHQPVCKAVHQIVDFWNNKVEQGLPSGEVLRAQLTEKLSKPHGEDATYQDENGITVPLAALRQRIIGCHVILSNGQQPERRLNAERVKLAETIARTQSALRVIMDQYDLVVRFDIIMSIDILCHTLANIIDVISEEPINLNSPNFTEKFEEIMCARN